MMKSNLVSRKSTFPKHGGEIKLPEIHQSSDDDIDSFALLGRSVIALFKHSRLVNYHQPLLHW